MAIAGRDNLIRVWDLKEKTEPIVLYGHQLFTPFVLFVSPDGKNVISVDLDREIIRVSTVPMDAVLKLAKRTVGCKDE